MRFLLMSALLAATASCAWPPPPPLAAAPAAAPPGPPPVALFAPAPPLAPPPQPVPVMAAPPPVAVAVAAPAPPPAFYLPNPFAWLFAPLSFAAPAGQVTLSNFSYDTARVETLVTPFADCAPRPGTAASDFALPLNGTRIIQAAPGSDVCWRRALTSEPGQQAPGQRARAGMPGWTEWSRVYTASGGIIDSRL